MKTTKHPYLTMMGLYLGAFVGMFGETALNIALPQLSAAFSVDTSLMQWMVIGHMLVIGLVLPFASLLMKWFPVRKLTLLRWEYSPPVPLSADLQQTSRCF